MILEKKIRGIALDVDGVLTDGTFTWDSNGMEYKKFSFADVMGISLGRQKGLLFTLISGEDTPQIDKFANKMNINDVYKGCKDKVAALTSFVDKHGIELSDMCFMGDDVNDLEVMSVAGFSAAPANAQPVVKDAAELVTINTGGQGAVRELIDYLLSNE